jgi:chromosome partitioning protein
MITFALANKKGGVGKTTSAVHLAVEFATMGYRTLLVDADPQANTTEFFHSLDDLERGLESVLIRQAGKKAAAPQPGIADVAVSAHPKLPNLALAPNLAELGAFESVSDVRVGALRSALEAVSDRFDFCFIDTPPTLGKLVSAALVACDYVLIPCQSQPMSLSAIGDLLGVIEEARALNPKLQVAGSFVTMFNRRTKIAAAVRERLASDLSTKAFETVIHSQVSLIECWTERMPVQLYDPKSKGAADYHALATEIIEHLGITKPGAPVMLDAKAAGSPRPVQRA